MGVKSTGFKGTRNRVRNIPDKAKDTFATANRESGEEIVATAKVLIPEKSGEARSQIFGMPLEGTKYVVDFGRLARIIEGDTEDRYTKDGKYRGRRMATPFANPAISSTRRKRLARFRKALKEIARNG